MHIKYQYQPSLLYSMFYEMCVAITKITSIRFLHVVITTVDCVDMSFVTLYKPTIKYFMSYYKYTLEESTELVFGTKHIVIVKTFWRGFAELAKTLTFKLFYFTYVNSLMFYHLETRFYTYYRES